MSKAITYVLAVTDMSGSMVGLVDDVRGGFNTHLSDLKAAAKEKALDFRMSVTLFDTEFIPLAVASKLEDVPELTEKNYYARGATALLDAVGKTVTEFEAKTKLRKKDRVILFIQTDGQENSSREFTWGTIRDLLEAREKTGQWAIIYVGQGVEAWSQGHLFGGSTQTVMSGLSAADNANSYDGRTRSTIAYAAGAPAASMGSIVDDAINNSGD